MAYERVNWENLPSKKTPVNADNLNKTDKGIANAVEKTGDTMTGDLNMQSNSVKFGTTGNVLWREDGYGDKFRIIPNFSGTGAENKLIIQSTTGGLGTDPQNWKDLVTIHADSGQVDLIHPKGNYSTEEVRIGTWIDGKPLYRKVFTLSNQAPTSSNADYVDIRGLGINELTLFRGILKSSKGGKSVIPFTDSSSNYNVFIVTQTHIRGRFQLGDGGTSANLLFILEYTKTTD